MEEHYFPVTAHAYNWFKYYDNYVAKALLCCGLKVKGLPPKYRYCYIWEVSHA